MNRKLLRVAALLLFVSLVSSGCGEPAGPAPLSPSSSSPAADTSAPGSEASAGPGYVEVAATAAPEEAAGPELRTVVLYTQPQSSKGGFLYSSFRDPDGSDADQWTWDSFAFQTTQNVTEVRWLGAYDPARGGSGGPVLGFTVDIFGSIASGIEPDLTKPPLVHYEVTGNAGETPAGVVDGVQFYRYQFVLPDPFQAIAWTQYWLQIEAHQSGVPDWALAKGTNGDLQGFRRLAGAGFNYQAVPGDAAFDLLGPGLEDDVARLELAESPEEIAELIETLPPVEQIPVSAEGVQELVLVVSRSGYTPGHFSVKPGVPVRLTFRQLGYVPGGNILLIHWDSNEEISLVLRAPADTKVLTFTPQQAGQYRFRCPHDWYEGVMTVQD